MASAAPNAVGPDGVTPVLAPAAPPKPRKPRPNNVGQPSLGGFFGFQTPPPQPTRSRRAGRACCRRVPGNVGPSSAPGFFTRYHHPRQCPRNGPAVAWDQAI